MRELILKRIAEIGEKSDKFSKALMRWESCYINNIHISKVNFEELNDADLIEMFEKIMRNYYKQM